MSNDKDDLTIGIGEDNYSEHETNTPNDDIAEHRKLVDSEDEINNKVNKDIDNLKSDYKKIGAVILAISIIAVVFIWASFVSGTFMFEPELTRYSGFECTQVVDQGKVLMEKYNNPDDFIPIVPPSKPIDNKTIVPAGVISKM